MKPSAVLYETHMHTPLCKHAVGEPEEYAAVADDRGLRGIIVTCHNPMPDGYSSTVRMDQDEFDTYLEMVERARVSMEGDVEVRLGLECDFFPGYESFLANQISSAPFEYILGSVHPQLRHYYDRFFDGDAIEFQKGYFTHLAEASETKLFDCLSHPDLVKNCFADSWKLELVLDHVLDCLDRIAAVGTAMELNTSGLNKSISEFNPSTPILELMNEREIPIVIGADAHVPERVGASFDTALDVIEAAGYEQISFFLGRKRHDVDISRARDSLTLTG